MSELRRRWRLRRRLLGYYRRRVAALEVELESSRVWYRNVWQQADRHLATANRNYGEKLQLLVVLREIRLMTEDSRITDKEACQLIAARVERALKPHGS